ncbi:hypothetical protein POTOM_053698 [Populus tomentosa]|uniref:Uncharacterized protein n=1 Tax=Populus tomentosa TaxID=118781 RepID=A0A8X8C4S8_POPTO|nr:hypothetical protein POTOM_053698 [Populus tomentosa]
MEAFYKSGKARAIRVNNFSSKKLGDLLAVARVHPPVNQVDYHPFVLLSTDVRSGNSGSHGAGVAAVRAAAEVALEMGVAVRLVMGMCGLPCLGRYGRRRGGAPLVSVKAKWVSACEREREIMVEGLWWLRRRWVVGPVRLAGTPLLGGGADGKNQGKKGK